MSSLTYGSPMLPSSWASCASLARVFQVPSVSPVNAMAERWSAQGPAGYAQACEAWFDAPILARSKPRSPSFTICWAVR